METDLYWLTVCLSLFLAGVCFVMGVIAGRWYEAVRQLRNDRGRD